MQYRTALATSAYTFQTDRVPVGLAAQLKRDGLATAVDVSDSSIDLESSQSLAQLIRAIERAGAEIFSIRRSHAPCHATPEIRPVRVSASRLKNPLSSCWLPTAPGG